MKQYASVRQILALGALTLSTAAAHAAPAATASPPDLLEGFQVLWATNGSQPHSISAAEAILAAPTTAATQVLNTINIGDSAVPFQGTDPVFAVRVTGYLTLAAGDYSFRVTHDDGALLSVGGAELISFDSDTSPVATTSATYTLAAGVYAVSLLSWEQGGQFLLNFEASRNGADYALLQGWHAAAVPEPAAWALLAAGLGLVGALARRHRG